jgi:hypothetical protein
MPASGRSLAVVTIVTAITASSVVFIHHGQRVERQNLHAGVIRDKELLKEKSLVTFSATQEGLGGRGEH